MPKLPSRSDPARVRPRLAEIHEPLQSTAVAVLDPNASGGFSLEALIGRIRSRLAACPDLRRRLDLEATGAREPDPGVHVHPVVPTEAVSERALCALVGELSARPLAGGRPPWNLYVIEGLCGGLVALVLVVDQRVADPRAALALQAQLLGLEPERRTGGRRVASAPAGLGPPREERRRPVAADPAVPARPRSGDAARAGAAAARRWQGELGPLRVSAYARSHRAAIDVVRRAFGGTREDVALAACTRALRRHLQAHGDPVTRPLVAALPDGSRAEDREGRYVRLVRLPVQIHDPVDQLRMVQSETYRARVAEPAQGECWLGRPAAIAWPAPFPDDGEPVAGAPVRPAHDLVFAYGEGPARTLYLDGARVVALHPHGALLTGAALDLRVLAYGDSVDFGLMASVPDAVEIAMGIDSAVADLVKRSFEEREGALELAGGEAAR